MPKTEVVNNEALTVRVNKGAAVNLVEETVDAVEEHLDEIVTLTRNNPLVIGLALVAGVGLGTLVAYRIIKPRLIDKFEDQYANDLEEAKQYLAMSNKTGDFATPESAVEALVPPEVAEALGEYQGREAAQKVDYARISTARAEAAKVEEAQTTEVVAVEETLVRNVFADRKVDDDWSYDIEQQARDENPDAPFIIHFDEYQMNAEGHDNATLTYFAGDDRLVDEKLVIVDNVEYIVGEDNLLRFGHGSGDKDVVYIRNERIGTDYQVIRDPGYYDHDFVRPDIPKEFSHSEQRNERRRRQGRVMNE